jgi:Tol biopolymer transport system component
MRDSTAQCRRTRATRATPSEELFLVPRDGGDARQLTRLGVTVRGVAWRPDSSALAFVADTHQRDEYTYDRADLVTVTTAGSLTRLTDDGFDHASPAWSSTGDAVFALREQSLNRSSPRSRPPAPTDV